MTKQIFIDLRGIEWEVKKRYITYAIEKNFDGIIADSDDLERIRKLGKIKVFSENLNSDYVLTSDAEILKRLDKKKAFYKRIENKDDEREVVFMKNFADYFLVETSNWKVIPLENLISEIKSGIIAEVGNFDDAMTALSTLEKGCDGIAITTLDINEIKKIAEYVSETYQTTAAIPLTLVKIKTIKKLDMGDRVCIDTASMLKIGEGMLIGSQSNGLFLIHSETLESEYVNSRPFRVNAGAVGLYILCPGGKTKYLSEVSAGDEMLIVDLNGNTRKAYVVRSKIESRPLILIEAVGKIEEKGVIEERTIKILLQNAETIRLINKDGRPVSITELKVGDEILAYLEEGGRHFGTKVDETIIER
ncbi:MAG: hypothetical protein BWK75_00965 [Candidatus Altiarchaeales archaeon A3]|nr:MAG: hypothetical protein BWK75_00965 [Candidatus Altiarchaeales archaeon A3]